MGFPSKVKEDVMVACGRCCSLCREFKGLKIEVHHIKPVAQGGADTFNNAIPLCFDCHGDMRTYDAKHPKGTKYTEAELIRRRDDLYQHIKLSGGFSNQVDNANQITDHDRKLLNKINEMFPFNYLDRLSNEPFGKTVSRSLISPIDDFIYSREGDPLFTFDNPKLESLKQDAIQKGKAFDNHFARQSGGGLENCYEYIDLNEVHRRSPENIDYWKKYSNDTCLLAKNFCEALLILRNEARYY